MSDGTFDTTYFLFDEPHWLVGDFTDYGDWVSSSVSGWVEWKKYEHYYGTFIYQTDFFDASAYNCTQYETFEIISKT